MIHSLVHAKVVESIAAHAIISMDVRYVMLRMREVKVGLMLTTAPPLIQISKYAKVHN